jgi:hypothetical protein
MSISVEHFADGTLNNCDSIREWDATDKVIYNKVCARATSVPQHHLDILIPVKLQKGFTAFDATAFKITYKTIGTSAWVQLVKVIDSAGVEQTSGLPAAVQNAAKSVLNVLTSALTGTFTAETMVYLLVRGMSDAGTPFSAEVAQIGPVEIGM